MIFRKFSWKPPTDFHVTKVGNPQGSCQQRATPTQELQIHLLVIGFRLLPAAIEDAQPLECQEAEATWWVCSGRGADVRSTLGLILMAGSSCPQIQETSGAETLLEHGHKVRSLMVFVNTGTIYSLRNTSPRVMK
jgi:hypothetical protein